MSVNKLECFGNYSPKLCGDCPKETRWECLTAAQLQATKEANRLARRRAGQLGPVGRSLAQRGYPIRIAVEADWSC